jgi:hypothetical protein
MLDDNHDGSQKYDIKYNIPGGSKTGGEFSKMLNTSASELKNDKFA